MAAACGPEPTLQHWRLGLAEGEQAQGLENMKRWQEGWSEPCRRLCCFSPDCASQRCCACSGSISRCRGDRAVCMRCPMRFVDRSASWDVAGGFQLCSTCFRDEAVLHQHDEFCNVIGASGSHELKRRCAASVAAWRELSANDCVPAVSGADEGSLCAFCFCPFDIADEDDPPCTWPGCAAQPPHFADASRDPKRGLLPGEGRYAHRGCFANWFQCKANEGNPYGYCGEVAPVLCAACEHERESAAWRQDFETGAAAAAEAFAASAGDDNCLPVQRALQLLAHTGRTMEVASPSLETVRAKASVRKDGIQVIGRAAFADLLVDCARALHPQPWIQEIAASAIRLKFSTSS
eukprot:TRINITY_DN38670_c0_g1_i1.p1 TRINITY_DN38670_c0_g1~~TRINITY_DN38670_c0_g1_i1.p1  ORF type:complete len:350 (-),score=66.51 TRINITY_DN38670_c0_g1_i1:90-1139(-)